MQEFGKYTLHKRLAFGGMAEIFLASLRGTQGFEKRVVLKRILPQFSADAGFTQMFIDEAVIAARLSHQNVAQVYDFGEVDGTYFIAMEYVDGADLKRLLKGCEEKGRPLSIAEVTKIGEEICAGMSYVHNVTDDNGRSHNIVHRDMSPHNVMISRGGSAKVMDFGIAKAEQRATHTATGMVKGKLAYMAPEQAAGQDIDKRADQFAVGLVLWEALVGRRLFSGSSDLDLLRQVVECRIQPASALRVDVPPALDAIIQRALSKDPAARFADLRDMEGELSRFRFSLGAAGAVDLGRLVDELVPRERLTGPTPQQRRTQVLDPGGGTAAGDGSGEGEGEGGTAAAEAETSNAGDAARGWGDGTAPAARTTSSPSGARGATAGGSGARRVEPSADDVDRAESHDAGAAQGPPSRMPWLFAAVAVVAAVVAVGFVASRPGGASDRTELSIDSVPPGAGLWLGGADTGLVTPLILPDQERGSRLSVELRRAGFVAWRTEVALVAPRQRIEATLVAEGVAPASTQAPIATPVAVSGVIHEPVAAAPPTVVPTPSAAPTAAPASPPVEAAPVAVAKKAKAKAARERSEGTAFLSMRSLGPWLDVYLGGKKIGTTPLSRVEVPAGTLRLRLKNGEAGVDKALTLEVGPGEELRHAVPAP